jgi:hypothetical protein
MASAKTNIRPGAASDQASATGAKTAQPLEADPDSSSALPIPKQHTMSSLGTAKRPSGETPFRKELDASIPADLGSVLAFYRSELGKRGWKEASERTVIKPDLAQLAFSSPDGPATLKLGRNNSETTVNLVQKNPTAAAQADVMPKPGQARLMFGNIGNGDAILTINRQTVKIAAGSGAPQSPKGPTLDLSPGKYPYAVKVAGLPVRNGMIEVAADDTWGIMVGPGGAMPLQLY